MALQKASRKKLKIKIGLSGSAGSGKTMSALLLAYGITKEWSKIALIDTENRSSELYVGAVAGDTTIGEFMVSYLSQPYTPERYIDAIKECEADKNIEVIIVDSMTHEWDGKGGCLDAHDALPGNSFTNWAKITPRHNRFIETIINADKFVICTLRSKQDYVLVEKNGKQVPEKVGLKAITREGVDYEFTLVFNLDIKHNAESTKDRTSKFIDKPAFVISPATGEEILKWCETGDVPVAEDKRMFINAEQFNQALARINNGELDVYSKVTTTFRLSAAQDKSLSAAVESFVPELITGTADYLWAIEFINGGGTIDELELKFKVSEEIKKLLIPS